MPKTMSSAEIRQAFIDFFVSKGHEAVASSPLPIPENPTLLFTNAGMNQFVDVFLGNEKRAYTRAVTAQKVMRVQGKHNDLENVGPSPRHHTFFEMLGNFSFGDYFKEDAIDYAWEFITEWLGLEPERIWATIYLDDDESFELWQKYLPQEKILRFDEKDNFWRMGDTGPCGPNSELFYYVGDLDKMDGKALNADDDEEYLEFWNLVFMQFDSAKDGTLTPLPAPSVDTGMGMERITRILQHAATNYETDLFSSALDMVQELLGDSDEERAEKFVGYRVLADHGRAATFLIGDGVLPGNTAENYVLRMIIRRAARFGRKIGFTQPFMAHLAEVYIQEMGDTYPQLRANAELIKQTLTSEEKKFDAALDKALVHFDRLVAETKSADGTVIAGDSAFNLLSTYGLPIEITRDLAGENGMTVDMAGYAQAQDDHAVASGKGSFGAYAADEKQYADVATSLIEAGKLSPNGVINHVYTASTLETSLLAIFKDGESVESAQKGDKDLEFIFAETVFYVESGGEVSDTGMITFEKGDAVVTNMTKKAGLILHNAGITAGSVSVGESVTMRVNIERQLQIRRNHTATHILHQELRDALGKHVTQQGSLVAPDRLRFDFSHGEAVTQDQLTSIEKAINTAVLANYGIVAEEMPKEDAIARGAMALFGEKYGDIVRTVQIGPDGAYSTELCGGLHVGNTGEIGMFKFTNEGSAAGGVRRVEAVTGDAALAYVNNRLATLNSITSTLNTRAEDIEERVSTLLAENKRLQKEVASQQKGNAAETFTAMMDNMQDVAGVPLLVGKIDGADADTLRELTDTFRSEQASGVAVLATVSNDKPLFIASVSKDLIGKGIKAGDLVREMGKTTGGGGGGAPHLAQAGGRDASKLDEALGLVPGLIEKAVG